MNSVGERNDINFNQKLIYEIHKLQKDENTKCEKNSN